MNHTSGNQLRVHRRRSGLSQQEVALVLGSEDRGAVSRYERGHHLPPLPVAIALEVLFVVPVTELFSGLREGISGVVEERLSKLEAELGARSARDPQAAITAKKLLWLMDRRNVLSSAYDTGDGS